MDSGKKLTHKARLIMLLIGVSLIALFTSHTIYSRIFAPIFVISLIGIGLVFCYKNIELLFWVFIFSLPFTKVPEIISNITMLPSQAIIFVLAILWFFQTTAQKDKALKLPKTAIDLPLAIFLIVNLLSIYQSYNIPLNYADFAYPTFRNKPFIKSITQIMFLAPGILSYYMTVIFLRNREQIIKAIKVWLLALLFTTLIGMYEFIIYYLGIIFKSTKLILPFGNYLCSSWNVRYLGSFPVLRVSSVALEPIFFADYIVSLLPLAIIIFISKLNLFKRRHLLLTIIILLVLCLIFTFSSSSIYVIISTCIFAVFLTRKRNPKLYRKIVTIGIVIILLVLIPFHRQAFQKFILYFDTRDYHDYYHISSFHRAVCLKAAFNMFLRHPLLGVGTGNFDFNFLENLPHPNIIELMRHTGMPRMISNIYFEILAETGIFGLISFLCILYFLLKKPLLRIRYMQDKFWDTLLLGLVLGFIALLVYRIFISAFYFQYVWVLMGLITATVRAAQEEQGYG